MFRKISKQTSYIMKRLFHSKKCGFVVDNTYNLVSKLLQKSSFDKTNPLLLNQLNNYPSSFARNLLHPYSNHVVSTYAKYNYFHSPLNFAEFPIHFLPAEIYSRNKQIETDHKTHDLIVWPNKIKINNISIEDIPQIVRTCQISDNSTQNKKLIQLNYLSQKVEGIYIHFFCDLYNIKECVSLLYCFEHFFSLHKFEKDVSYVFACDVIKLNMYSNISIYYGDNNAIKCSYAMTIDEVGKIVSHITSSSKK